MTLTAAPALLSGTMIAKQSMRLDTVRDERLRDSVDRFWYGDRSEALPTPPRRKRPNFPYRCRRRTAVKINALFPDVISAILSAINEVLPRDGGIDQ